MSGEGRPERASLNGVRSHATECHPHAIVSARGSDSHLAEPLNGTAGPAIRVRKIRRRRKLFQMRMRQACSLIQRMCQWKRAQPAVIGLHGFL